MGNRVFTQLGPRKHGCSRQVFVFALVLLLTSACSWTRGPNPSARDDSAGAAASKKARTSFETEMRQIAEARRQAPAGDDHVFAVSDVTPFGWSTLHVFGPYRSQDQVEGELGVTLKHETHIESNDAMCLLVFLDEEGEVVENLDVSRHLDMCNPAVENAPHAVGPIGSDTRLRLVVTDAAPDPHISAVVVGPADQR